MNGQPSLARDYFETLYAESDDPWSFETSDYEAEKYARSLAVLRPSYSRGLEIGCSIGVFTHQLAKRCEHLLAIDISERALRAARRRCADEPHVAFARATVPYDFPNGTFDLITCCEVAYYWSDRDLAAVRERIATALVAGGDVLFVHWLPKVDDYVRDGDAVHEAFIADRRYERVAHHRTDRYRLDLLRRA